jgi:hypothetical protein
MTLYDRTRKKPQSHERLRRPNSDFNAIVHSAHNMMWHVFLLVTTSSTNARLISSKSLTAERRRYMWAFMFYRELLS